MGLPYKLLAVDLDGTLLDSKNRLPEENRSALHRAHEAGLIVCLTTGRCYSETRAVLESLGLGEVVAIGDATNDLEMIRGAGLSFAMANADPEVKRAATRVTRSNDHAGVHTPSARSLTEPQADTVAGVQR